MIHELMGAQRKAKQPKAADAIPMAEIAHERAGEEHFASNPQMVASLQRRFTGIDETVPSCEAPSNDGTILLAAEEIGAATANMQFIQFYGYPEVSPTRTRINMNYKLVVNTEGERFDNDSKAMWYGGGVYDQIVAPCNQPGGRYSIFGDGSNAQELQEVWRDYQDMGILVTGSTLGECANGAGISADSLNATVEAFNTYCRNGEDPDFGRPVDASNAVGEGDYFLAPFQMYAQQTTGGLVINIDGNVLDDDGNPIEGLFAAGETCGNLDGGWRRHGDNFAQILYYGYRCGEVVSAL